MHNITGTKALAERSAGWWTFASTIQNRSQAESEQADDGYQTVKLHMNGSFKYAFISPEPPGVLIRRFLANIQTGNCSLTAGNFHQTAVNLCISQLIFINMEGYSNQTAADFNHTKCQLIKH